EKTDFPDGYWNTLWGWYHAGGFGHVAAHLAALDLSDFDPKAPPPKTPAFWEIVGANQAPEEGELQDLLDEMGNPDVVTLAQLIAHSTGETQAWLADRKIRRALPHRLDRVKYVPVRNPDVDGGLWKIKGKRQAIYGKASLSAADLIRAARKL